MPRPLAAWTLGGRLVLIAAFAMIASLVASGLAMYSAAKTEDEAMLDIRLGQMGAVMLGFLQHELAEHPDAKLSETEPPIETGRAATLYQFQVWSRDGQLQLHGSNSPTDRPLMPLDGRGFQTMQSETVALRVYALEDPSHTFVVQVAESAEDRTVEVMSVTLRYLWYLLVPFVLLFAATQLLLRQAMRSISGIATQLTMRNPMDVTRLQVDRPPAEVLPILQSLDALFERMGQALSAERRFTSMAAHEMKTPLAGIRAQAQLAARSDSPEESREALGALIVGVDRSSHMLDQLLDMARIETLSTADDTPLATVDMAKLVHDVSQDLATLAATRQVLVTTDMPVRRVHGHYFGLHLAIRNLMVNAIRHGREHGRVHVSVSRRDDNVLLQVDDSGCGIAPKDRQKAFERFNRLGLHHAEGVGLGLSIVLMVVELHSARIQLLDSPLGGLRVQITFDEPPEDAAQPPLQSQAAPT
jgi:signal transduction histidine kinase